MTGTTLVTGITGQDGSYLAEALLERGRPVVGLVRKGRSAGSSLPASLIGRVEVAEWDMQDALAFQELLGRYQPRNVFNLAAYARGTGMFDDPVSMGEINGLAVTRMLEAISATDPSIRFCQASSSEMYGETPSDVPATEHTPMRPVSPYGAAKLYAHSMVGAYRRRHGMFACSAILFNHESPRRGMDYVTRKITHAAARIRLGLADELSLGDIDARRDWGYAPDYVEAMVAMLDAVEPGDYVVATGELHSVRDVCEVAFSRVGLDYRDFLVLDAGLQRPGTTADRAGDAARARRELNWRPTLGFRNMVECMVDHDMKLLADHPH